MSDAKSFLERYQADPSSVTKADVRKAFVDGDLAKGYQQGVFKDDSLKKLLSFASSNEKTANNNFNEIMGDVERLSRKSKPVSPKTNNPVDELVLDSEGKWKDILNRGWDSELDSSPIKGLEARAEYGPNLLKRLSDPEAIKDANTHTLQEADRLLKGYLKDPTSVELRMDIEEDQMKSALNSVQGEMKRQGLEVTPFKPPTSSMPPPDKPKETPQRSVQKDMGKESFNNEPKVEPKPKKSPQQGNSQPGTKEAPKNKGQTSSSSVGTAPNEPPRKKKKANQKKKEKKQEARSQPQPKPTPKPVETPSSPEVEVKSNPVKSGFNQLKSEATDYVEGKEKQIGDYIEKQRKKLASSSEGQEGLSWLKSSYSKISLGKRLGAGAIVGAGMAMIDGEDDGLISTGLKAAGMAGGIHALEQAGKGIVGHVMEDSSLKLSRGRMGIGAGGAIAGLGYTMFNSKDDNLLSTTGNVLAGSGMAMAADRLLLKGWGESAINNGAAGDFLGRVFNANNLEVVTKEMTEESFLNMQILSGHEDTNLTFKNDSLHYSAHSDGTIKAQNAVTGTAGINYLRVTNDPIYQDAQKMFGKNPTNKQILDFIMAHEFGHIDHFKKGIGVDDFDDYKTGNESMLKDRKAYKETGAEKYADDYARNLLSSDEAQTLLTAKDVGEVKDKEESRRVASQEQKKGQFDMGDMTQGDTKTKATENAQKESSKKKSKNFSGKLGVLAAIGATTIGAASLLDTSRGLREDARAERMKAQQEENLIKQRNMQRRNREEMGYGNVDFGQMAIDMFNERIGHHKMGNSKFY